MSPTRIPLFIIRGLFFLCAVGTGSYLAKLAGEPEQRLLYMGVAAALAIAVVLSEVYFSRSPIALVSSITFGLIIGFLVAWLFTGLIEVVAQPSPMDLQAIRLVLTLVSVYFGVTLLIQTKDDFKFIIPYVEFKRELGGARPAVLDTSALVDGRFAELCRLKVFEAPIVVPRFVLAELQALADSDDKGKRARGRRGLDIVKSLRDGGAALEIAEEDPPGEGVDRKIVVLASRVGGILVTTDQALQKLGALDGVTVLNVHDLARALQTRALAGARLTLKLVKPGEGAEQGVGYLEDGSMVVDEKGRGRVGEEVSVEVTGNIKTSAGQMFFAKIAV